MSDTFNYVWKRTMDTPSPPDKTSSKSSATTSQIHTIKIKWDHFITVTNDEVLRKRLVQRTLNWFLSGTDCAGWGHVARMPNGRPVNIHSCFVNSPTALEDLDDHYTLWKTSSNVVMFSKHGETRQLRDLKGAGQFTYIVTETINIHSKRKDGKKEKSKTLQEERNHLLTTKSKAMILTCHIVVMWHWCHRLVLYPFRVKSRAISIQ